MTVYEYLPLVQDNSIRVLDISPGTFSDDLCVQVRHESLTNSNRVSYEALSYVWGSKENPVRINVENTVLALAQAQAIPSGELLITKNLATALKHLRDRDRPMTVWADAICINQEDVVEKGRQVAMMGEIYRLASRVVAFLGPEQNDSTYALEMLEDLSSKVEVDYSTGLIKPSAGSDSAPEYADIQQTLQFEHRELLAINHLVHLEWFERLWIRQEIGSGGPNGILLCGKKEIAWPAFTTAIFLIGRKPFRDLLGSKTAAFRERLLRADDIGSYSIRGYTFLNLRRQIGYAKCADPRDRIYAVLSQLRNAQKFGIVADYTKSASELYVDIAMRHIKRSKNLFILSQAKMRGNDLSLPSWVPDWTKPLEFSNIHTPTPLLFDLFPACLSIDARILSAYGVFCGTIEAITEIDEMMFSGNDARTLQEVRRLITASNTNALTNKHDESFLEAHCRTFCVDNFADRWDPPVPQEPPFQHCLEVIRSVLNSDTNHTGKLLELEFTASFLAQVRWACKSRNTFTTRRVVWDWRRKPLSQEMKCAFFFDV